jgi:hypothetical protein
MGGGAVKCDYTALVAVRRVGWPCGLVPSAFEVVRDLGKCKRKESESEKSGLAEHYYGWMP